MPAGAGADPVRRAPARRRGARGFARARARAKGRRSRGGGGRLLLAPRRRRPSAAARPAPRPRPRGPPRASRRRRPRRGARARRRRVGEDERHVRAVGAERLHERHERGVAARDHDRVGLAARVARLERVAREADLRAALAAGARDREDGDEPRGGGVARVLGGRFVQSAYARASDRSARPRDVAQERGAERGSRRGRAARGERRAMESRCGRTEPRGSGDRTSSLRGQGQRGIADR